MSASAFILIMFVANSSSYHSGAAGISQQFNTEKACLMAGRSIADEASRRSSHVISWGCFPKASF